MLHATLVTILCLELELLLVEGLDANLGGAVAVEHLLVPKVDVHRVHKGEQVANDGDQHGEVGIVVGHDGARSGREDHATRDGGHETGTAEFGVSTESSQAQ